MQQFVIEGVDGKQAAALRAQHREGHVAHLVALGERFVIGGPLLDDNGNEIGSLVVIEAVDRAAANAFAGADPFVQHGVFDKVTVRRWSFGHLRQSGRG